MIRTALVIVSVFALGLTACSKKEKEAPKKDVPAVDDKAAAEAKKKAATAAALKKKQEEAKAKQAAMRSAVATMKPTKGSKVAGTVALTQAGDGPVNVRVELTGLKPGQHGFHIHDKGDCSSDDGKSAGGHFNPSSVDHGAPSAATKHAGDFGNVTADKDGKVSQSLTFDFVTLGEGDNSVIERGVIVHAKPDDLKSQPTGAAGARMACGVIKKK